MLDRRDEVGEHAKPGQLAGPADHRLIAPLLVPGFAAGLYWLPADARLGRARAVSMHDRFGCQHCGLSLAKSAASLASVMACW